MLLSGRGELADGSTNSQVDAPPKHGGRRCGVRRGRRRVREEGQVKNKVIAAISRPYHTVIIYQVRLHLAGYDICTGFAPSPTCSAFAELVSFLFSLLQVERGPGDSEGDGGQRCRVGKKAALSVLPPVPSWFCLPPECTYVCTLFCFMRTFLHANFFTCALVL